MHALFQRILRWVLMIWGILIDKVPSGKWSWVYRAVHWLAVILITVLLARYSDEILKYFGKGRASVSGIEIIGRYYCGFLFAAGYVFVRTVLFAIGLFSWRDVSEFPDIDAAWDRGLQSLDRLGYDIRDVPVFAVLGTTTGTESAFFSAAGIEWKAVVPAREEDALSPLRLYLGEKACFVALSQVGAFSRQLGNAESAAPDGGFRGPAGRVLGNLGATQRPNAPAQSPSSSTPTMTPQQFAQLSQGDRGPASSPSGGMPSASSYGRQMTLRPGMLAGAHQTLAPGQSAAAGPSGLPAPLEQSQMALGLRRLNYFLRLLSLDREPFCGINGLLVLLPGRWSATSESCTLLNSLKEDLQRFQSELRLSFPVVALLCDVESFTGFRVFLDRLRKLEPQIEDKTRAGTRFPMGAVLDRRHSEWVVDKSIEWFRDWIFKLFAVTAQDARRDEIYRGLDDSSNRDLYSLLCTFQKRRTTLWRQLELAFKPQGELPLRVSGYYFMAKEPSRAFLRGVLQKLEDEQNEVAYFPSSCRRDRRMKAWATLAVIGGLGLLIADVVLAWQLFQRLT